MKKDKPKSKKEHISKISNGGGKGKKPKGIDLSFLKLGSPLEIINSSSKLILKFGKGEIEDSALRTIAYTITTCVIPAYKLLSEEKLAERYNRIADALEKKNDLTEQKQNEIR